MRRGEIWRAELDPPIGRRPVLLLSRDTAYEVRTSITVAPVTRTIRSIPSYIKLDRKDGMQVNCAIDLDDIATVQRTP
jgi:mRNA interferase MazF